MPPVTPVNIPDKEPTVAIDVVLLLHTPPDVPSVNVSVAPVHTEEGTVIGPGAVVTVTVFVI